MYRVFGEWSLERVEVRLNRWDWDWLLGRGSGYIEERLLSGECRVKAIGEISAETLSLLEGLGSGTDWDRLVEEVVRETGTITWGPEGGHCYRVNVQILGRSRIRELQRYCLETGRGLGQVLKGILLRERGYVVYRAELPWRNRLGVVALRRFIRRQGGGDLELVHWILGKLMGSIYDW